MEKPKVFLTLKHFFMGMLLLRSFAFSGPNQVAILSIDFTPETAELSSSLALNNDAEPFWVSIIIENSQKLDSYSFEVEFDNSLLEFIEARSAFPPQSPPNFLESRGGTPLGFIGKVSNRNAAHISIAHALIGSDSTQSPSGSGVLAMLKFKPLGKPGSAPLRIVDPQILNWKLQLDTQMTLLSANLMLSSTTRLKKNSRAGESTILFPRYFSRNRNHNLQGRVVLGNSPFPSH